MSKRVPLRQRNAARKSPSRQARGAPETVSHDRAHELASIFKMLSNPNRLRLILFLASGERTVGEMESLLGIHQPTLSQQIAELRDAAIVCGRRVARSAIYALTADCGTRALHTIQSLSGTMPHSAQMMLERSHHIVRSQPAAVFAALLAPNGESLAMRHRPPKHAQGSEVT